MKKFIKYSTTVVALTLMVGCASTRKITPPSYDKPEYSEEALQYIINGSIADLIGQPKDAVVEYHQAAEIDTSSPGIFIALAEDYYIMEKPRSCIRLAKKAVRLDPTNTDGLELLAASYDMMKNYKSALLIYEKLAELQPTDIETLYNLASLQILAHQYPKALSTYKNMVSAGLEDPDFRLRVGHLFLQSRAFKQAGSVYMDIQAQFPEFEASYLGLAAISKAQNDTAQVIKWYTKAIEYNNPNFTDAIAELLNIYKKQNKKR